MKKCFFGVLFLFFQICLSQPFQKWKGYFSYNKIKDISESNNKIYAAAENTMFTKNLATNDIKTINTIDGLSGQTISAIYHSDAFNKTIVGYEDGLMIVINDADGSMLNIVDIINKNIPANIKRVNHFMEYDGVLYVSCDFGVVQYKLATLEFGDTYFIGPAGQEIKVYQTAIFNGDIYAATQYNGIRKASVTNPNLIDYAEWEVFDPNYWTGIVAFNNQLIGMNVNTNIYKLNGGLLQIGSLGNQLGLDLRATADNIVVTGTSKVLIFNQTLNQIASIQNSQISSIPLTFTCGTVVNNIMYIGTNEKGIVSSSINFPNNFEYIMPNGPVLNNIFSINSSSSNLWAVYGGYDIFYNPYGYIPSMGPAPFGISKYNQSNGWQNIPYSDLLGAKALVRVSVNPNDENELCIASYNDGLIKIVSDVPTTLYNAANSTMEGGAPRINSTAYDKSGNLWLTQSREQHGLHVLKSNGTWATFDMQTILTDYASNDFCKIAIDKSGTKWIASYKNGVVAFNENSNIGFKKLSEGADLGNLPSQDVRAIAVDNRNQVWIGTNKGLRVLPSTGSYNNDEQMKANQIIILEDGLAQELLYEQFITDIAVNGSNQKWIGTADSGVFLFSYNGQETIYHFTKDNSPLPSNVINDIEINSVTGEIFFATDRGMVSFQGIATKPADNLNAVYVYPNPVRPEFVGTVKIAGLISKANIKITDIEGNLVYETTSEGGSVEWDTKAFGKYNVASGVYMIFIAAEDASETAVKKVMIIR